MKKFMSITIGQNTQKIDYEVFGRLNDLIFPNEPVAEVEYQAFIAANFWTIFNHDKPIGYAVMTGRPQCAHISRIGIHPDFRFQGLAKKLMDRMLEKAKVLRANCIDLLVQQDNQPAINLYKHFGFHVTGESVQFSVNITPMPVDNYSIIDVVEYKNSKSYSPHNKQILEWVRPHTPPHKLVLVFLKQDRPIGFVRFSPDFPGCSPFVLFTDVDIDMQLLVSLLNKYALPDKRTIKITTENTNAITLLKSAGTEVNYSLFEMTKTLV